MIKNKYVFSKICMNGFILFFFMLFTGCKSETPPVIRLSSVPDENQKEMMHIYKPLAQYLTQQLGVAVEFVPAVDYADVVEGVVEGRIDIARCGGLTSVQIKRKSPDAVRLVMRQEDTQVESVFITRLDTGIVTLGDLKGKTFTFGSVASTSAHLMARYFLFKNEIDPDKDFRVSPSYSGRHDTTVLWVERGKVDAGVLSVQAWEKLLKKGKVDRKTVVAFWTSPAYVDYVWMIREGFEKDFVKMIRKSFSDLKPDSESHKNLINLLETGGFIKAHDAQWKDIEKAAWTTGVLK